MLGKFVLCVATAFAGALAGTASGQDSPLFKEVEGWEIRVDKTLGDGCFAAAVYERLTFLRIGYNADADKIYLMIGDPKWKSLEAGKRYPLEIKFGNESPWQGDATAIGDDDWVALMMEVRRDNSGTFLREYMEEQFVEISYNDQPIATLALRGSYKAGLALIECQALFESHRQAGSGSSRNPGEEHVDPFAVPGNDVDDPFRES